LGEWSPLDETLSRYADFFALFGDYQGYVSFFLLDDLVTADGGVEFFLFFDEFQTYGRPKDLASYHEYRAARSSSLKQGTAGSRCSTYDSRMPGVRRVSRSGRTNRRRGP
jgi:hypothetical protein